MSTISQIKRHIGKLTEGDLFTTRHLLSYGTRNAVDLATSRLAKEGIITRLARGVFCKTYWGLKSTPSVSEVVMTKMQAWGKIVYPRAVLPERSKLPMRAGNIADDLLSYCVSGCTTSFMYRGQKIALKGTSPRKLDLGGTPIARLARAIWERGSKHIDMDYLKAVFRELFRPEKLEMASFFRQLPLWMNDQLDWVRNRRGHRVTIDPQMANARGSWTPPRR